MNNFITVVRNVAASRNTYVFFVCFALAVLIWLLNAFTKDYNTVMFVPVKYYNYPDQRVNTQKLPNKVDVEVFGYGFDLLAYHYFSTEDTLHIDIAGVQSRNVSNRRVTFINTASLIGDFSKQLGPNLRVTNVLTDTIFFNFEKKITKMIPLRKRLKLDFEKQFSLVDQVEMDPPAVRVSGPENIMDTLQFLYTELFEMKQMKTALTLSSSIPFIEENVNFSSVPSKVLIHIPVEEFTEDQIDVPLSVQHQPDTVRLKTYPDKVTVKYMVALSKFEEVKNEKFIASVNYNDLVDNPSKLKVQLTRFPKHLKILNWHPSRVEYIIKKND